MKGKLVLRLRFWQVVQAHVSESGRHVNERGTAVREGFSFYFTPSSFGRLWEADANNIQQQPDDDSMSICASNIVRKEIIIIRCDRMCMCVCVCALFSFAMSRSACCFVAACCVTKRYSQIDFIGFVARRETGTFTSYNGRLNGMPSGG